jgi:hypothetical protein
MRTTLSTLLVAAALAAAALAAVAGTLSGPAEWTPDGLFYQARSLEARGMDRDEALAATFGGPLGAELRRIDPERSGDPAWVRYNAQFYERRVLVPVAAAALEPLSGDRAVLDLSLAGYVAAVLALFGLLLLRFRLPVAAAVTLATIFVPALVHHASYPLTDSWGLALEIAALASGLLVLDRGPRWLIAWTACILLLSFTRDSTWIPILAALCLALWSRSRVAWAMAGTAVAATLPVLLLFPMPMRELLAQMLNDAQPDPGASWGAIAGDYPAAIVDLLQANGGFVRDGAWYSAAYLVIGLALLFALARGRDATSGSVLLKAGAVAGVAYVLAVPVFSAFRLELIWIPMAAFGLALGAERVLAAVSLPVPGLPARGDRQGSPA